jgi:hypothetical protein
MKKTRNIWMLFLAGIFLSLSIVAAQPVLIWATSSGGVVKSSFKTTDEIYVKSNAMETCSRVGSVDLYIVADQDNWTDGDTLEDVRGSPDSINLSSSKILLTKIWDAPQSGEYDLVVDCNKNGVYDLIIDEINNDGFSVEAVTGTAKAAKGSKSPGDHMWRYDPENVDFENEMLQISLTAEGEDVELYNMTIASSGSGDDTKIVALSIYADGNNNGKLDDAETLIGSAEPAFEDNNGKTVVDLDYFLVNKETENFLVVYTLDETLSEGEFSLVVESISGIGSSSGSPIKFSGLPISSGKKQVLPEKTCLGELSMEFSSNPADVGSKVTASFSGLEGCNGAEVSLRTNPCGSTSPKIIGTCKFENDTCGVEFNATSSITYNACIDKNGDNDSVDFGEYAFGDLVVKSVSKAINKTEETEEIEPITNETEETPEENISNPIEAITGNVVENVQEVSETSSFFILLEVTLLLILFVLVMILFRLKPIVVQAEKPSNGKSAKKDKEKSEEED